MYIKPKFLITQAAGKCRDYAAQDSDVQPDLHWLTEAVAEVILGNYSMAMEVINKGLEHCSNSHEETTALLELKNIVARLRLKCEDPEQLIGPTYKSTALPHSFSVHMLDVVQKVLRCRNHYEVLRISHHATYSEVKRAYKRLALRLHPDKNRAPGAEIAFRRINEAADILTDNQRRIEYNLLTAVGDGLVSKNTHPANKHDDGQDTCRQRFAKLQKEEEEEEAAAEAEQVQPRRSYQPANQRVPQRQSLYQTEQLVIGLVAALVFIIITLHYLATAPNYSFSPTSSHTVRMTSRLSRIPYFVTPEWAGSQTPKQLELLEQEIDEIYLNELKHNCKQERKLRNKLLQRARHINNRNLHEHALKMPTPACHALVQVDQEKYKLLDHSNEGFSNEF